MSVIDTSKPGTNPPDEINVVVEIPKGSSIQKVEKYLSTECYIMHCFILVVMALFLRQEKRVSRSN
ncbi:MAG: hypothetical protein WCF23_17655 [Candidatus Nitrosopolaris sp.]